MACRNAYITKTIISESYRAESTIREPIVAKSVNRLLLGVDSQIQADDLLQNNIDMFEWVVRNKLYPNFYGRYLIGENCLTKEEIKFLHSKGCKIAPIYSSDEPKDVEEKGILVAKSADIAGYELNIPHGTVIFLEIKDNEKVTMEYLRGYAKTLIEEGYTPGFKANTDAKFAFDREFSRGMQTDKDIFKKCLIWAVSPTVKEYNKITTTHLIHPDNWAPFAPSALTRAEIAIWQYGAACHPIEDDMGKVTAFNLDLVRNESVIIDKMF